MLYVTDGPYFIIPLFPIRPFSSTREGYEPANHWKALRTRFQDPLHS